MYKLNFHRSSTRKTCASLIVAINLKQNEHSSCFSLEFLISNLDTQNRFIFLYSIFFYSHQIRKKGKMSPSPKSRVCSKIPQMSKRKRPQSSLIYIFSKSTVLINLLASFTLILILSPIL